MVKAIFFDFWGTLVENGVWSPIKQVKNILRINLPFPEYVVRMEKAMMTQAFPSLKEAFQAICTEFSLEADDKQMDELIGIWNKSWMLAHPYEEVEKVLEELQTKYDLYLISNTDSTSILNVIEKFSLDQYFKKKFLSFDLGTIKTDPEFLETVLRETKLKREECMVVGDSLQSDVIAAEKAGIKAVLVDRRDKRDFHLKIKNLNELKEILND